MDSQAVDFADRVLSAQIPPTAILPHTVVGVYPSGVHYCRFYDTIIAEYDPAHKMVRFMVGPEGGKIESTFNTPTTRRRMNQVAAYWGLSCRKVVSADFKHNRVVQFLRLGK